MTDATRIDRELMEYDVVMVGASPSRLSAAIRLKQVDPDLSVVVLAKGSELGAHIGAFSAAERSTDAMAQLSPGKGSTVR